MEKYVSQSSIGIEGLKVPSMILSFGLELGSILEGLKVQSMMLSFGLEPGSRLRYGGEAVSLFGSHFGPWLWLETWENYESEPNMWSKKF